MKPGCSLQNHVVDERSTLGVLGDGGVVASHEALDNLPDQSIVLTDIINLAVGAPTIELLIEKPGDAIQETIGDGSCFRRGCPTMHPHGEVEQFGGSFTHSYHLPGGLENYARILYFKLRKVKM